jgi:hypothetical protein
VRGTNDLLTDAVELAKQAGYSEARIVERQILVASLVDPGVKAPELKDELVQIDLAPRSSGNFKKHRIGVAHRISKGLWPEGTNPYHVAMSCDVQSKGDNNWTDAIFSTPLVAAA